jgi:hypothetical protein
MHPSVFCSREPADQCHWNPEIPPMKPAGLGVSLREMDLLSERAAQKLPERIMMSVTQINSG